MRSGPKQRRYFRFLDALSSRIGIFLSTGFLIALCVGVGFYTQLVLGQLERSEATFKERQIRNGYVAMSDIQRLTLVAQQAANAGGMTDEFDTRFREAVDILFVRKRHLQTILESESEIESGKDAIAALDKIVSIADQALGDGYADLGLLTDTLLSAGEEARIELVQFLDDMRRAADRLMVSQSAIVRKQQLIMIGSLVGLTLVGVIALIFLRLEVLGRRARETAEKRVEFFAYFDPLTELPNRVQFQEQLQEKLDRAKRDFALLFIDLDEFKAINDTHGHAAGDAVLRRVGKLLEHTARDYKGFAARLGGDEFALVVPTDDPKILTELCETLLANVSASFVYEGEELECGVSIGLATTSQVNARLSASLDILSRVTDFALYTSKAKGRNCYTFYDLALEQRFLERRAMLEELPHAIASGDLEVFLQPKVTLPDFTVYGFEALVRWRRAGKIVRPDEFILLAEESGLVRDIDHFMLRATTKALANHNSRFGTDFSVSVNLSAIHFNARSILRAVKEALDEAHLPPELLTLEITETTELRDWKQANSVIRGLRKLGCKVAIDDFGTGFSSLGYLRTMVADELKVDRSLVLEVETSTKVRMLLQSVFEIARNMQLDVVVEGIETATQAKIVHDLGARKAQGYFFGRPDALPAVLEGHSKASPTFDPDDVPRRKAS